MNSTVGRPRALTDAQIAGILEWHRNRKSLVQVARENHVSPNTIRNAIRRRGEYKQPSPELRGKVVAARRKRIKTLETRYLL